MSALPVPGRNLGYMHEAELRRRVADRCRELGLMCYFIADSRKAKGRGWPDCSILGLRGLIFRELKGAGGDMSSAQRAVGYTLIAAGQNFGVWRPRHWFDGTIERELQELTKC